MNYLAQKYFIVIVCLSLQVISHAQTIINQTSDDAQVENFIFNEKLELETDHTTYLSGEEIKFSCITYDYILQTAIKVSKIAYVEFLTFDNNIIAQSKIELKNSCGNGSIQIPKELPTGIYYIRAHTNYMKNFSKNDYALNSITIINPLIPKNNNFKPLLNDNFDCTLYPEGGNIIFNRDNKIACVFKGNNSSPVVAVITDQNDSIIEKLSTNSLGIASTKLFPTNDKQYFIKAMNNEHSKLNKKVIINSKAIAITFLDKNDTSIVFKINSYSYSNYPLNFNAVYKNSIIKLLSVSKNDTIISIDRNKIPYGLINFQLEKNKNIISHRWINNIRTENIPISLKLEKNSFNTREEILLELQNLSIEKELYYSISFINIDSNCKQQYKDQTIKSVIKGELYPYISKLAIPLNSILNDSLLLDQTLLTFSENTFPINAKNTSYKSMKHIPELMDDVTHGKIIIKENNSIDQPHILQANIDSIANIQIAYPDSVGNFYFPVKNKIISSEIAFTTSSNKTHSITIEDEFSQDFISITQEPVYVDPKLQSNIQQRLVNLQILDLYMNNNLNDTINKQPFYIKPDKVLKMNEYPKFINFEQFVFEVLPWVTINKRNEQKVILISYKGSDKIIGFNPLYLIDGIPVFNSNEILELECKYLFSASVVYDKVFFQNMHFDGIIDIKTIEGNASILPNNKNLIKTRFITTTSSNKKAPKIPEQHQPYFNSQLYFSGFKNIKSINKEILFAPDYSSEFLIKCCIIKPGGSKTYFYKTFNVIKK